MKKSDLRLFFIITLIFSGLPWGGWLLYQYTLKWREQDPAYEIVGIVQRPGNVYRLQTAHLAEMMGLSHDVASNLFAFPLRKTEEILRKSQVFQKVKLRRIKPGTLFVDYTLHNPAAFLGDYSNTIMDKEGHLFPFKPFYTPKKLPEIMIRAADEEVWAPQEIWGKKLEGKKGAAALQLLSTLQQRSLFDEIVIQRIDVSKMESSSYGQREIVVILEDFSDERSISRILRLSAEDYLEGLSEFVEIRKKLLQKEKESKIKVKSVVIDLRIPQLAFIAEEKG